MELKNKITFKFDKDKIIYSTRGMYNFDKEHSENTLNREVLLNKINKSQVKEISEILDSIYKDYQSVEKLLILVDNHYGREVDYVFSGRDSYVDLFGNSDNFNVWVRFIPQLGENNVYIKIYSK